jgi:tRNA-splicing ligase RtcB
MAFVEYTDSRARPIKAWVEGVPFEPGALQQVRNVARLPIIHSHVAVMPDVHAGIGATVGTVIATRNAVIPAAVGVDIGCGMMAVRTSLESKHLPDSLVDIRRDIESAIPVGFADNARPERDPVATREMRALAPRLQTLLDAHPKLGAGKRKRTADATAHAQLGSLGGGNHFIEVCLDEAGCVWLMLHSGSRGVGNSIGKYFIELAKEDMRGQLGALPDKDLAYLSEGTRHFDDYWHAVSWAQEYAAANRRVMMTRLLDVLRTQFGAERAVVEQLAVNCHHNYVQRERHFDASVLVTRKGAVSARPGELGIIPGSMGARSYIVEGLGNPDSFHSCSHGAGRVMSRGEAKRRITLAEHKIATAGVECRKDAGVLDESPAAYKDIDAVMHAQRDLVRPVHTLRQILCIKG